MSYKVLLFYKYVPVEDPAFFMKEHLNFCLKNNIKGRVFVASEGINGTVSGLTGDIIKYKKHLRSFPEFNDIIFKEDDAEKHAFYKMHVRVKREIVNSNLQNTLLQNGGKRLSPEELHQFYLNNKDFVIVDARNWYEAKIGKFKNAVDPELKTFRDWHIAAELLKDKKDKTIVTYCTGGIRCEKASAFLVEQGFKDVYQLDGGIVSYTKKYPDAFWEGAVWVFDERRIVEPNSSEELKSIADCYFCGTKTSYYINCHNLDCDRILISCHKCKIENDYCCSDECRKSENKRDKYFG
jgi:UPF0176 protein